MYFVETEAMKQVRQDALNKMFWDAVEDAKRKREAREAWLKASTCPHCGRHDPLPPWLMF
jgi:hypothetical protein